jgi:hypothetical protein
MQGAKQLRFLQAKVPVFAGNVVAFSEAFFGARTLRGKVPLVR